MRTEIQTECMSKTIELGNEGRIQHKDHMYEELVLSIVELELFRKGSSTYDKVLCDLRNEYNCNIVDCYAHPEYLRAVLEKIFGDSYSSIIEPINKNLRRSTRNQTIDRFLMVMCE